MDDRIVIDGHIVIDLIGYMSNEDHMLMAVMSGTVDNMKILWHGKPVPFNDASTPICKELTERFNGTFPAFEDAEYWFVITHARNMREGKNMAGQDYPVNVTSKQPKG